jgi:hypothetical protein
MDVTGFLIIAIATNTKTLKVTADGPWTVTATSLQDLPRYDGSAPITGTGDSLFYYTGEATTPPSPPQTPATSSFTSTPTVLTAPTFW